MQFLCYAHCFCRFCHNVCAKRSTLYRHCAECTDIYSSIWYSDLRRYVCVLITMYILYILNHTACYAMLRNESLPYLLYKMCSIYTIASVAPPNCCLQNCCTAAASAVYASCHLSLLYSHSLHKRCIHLIQAAASSSLQWYAEEVQQPYS
jgi:hypothetical protein